MKLPAAIPTAPNWLAPICGIICRVLVTAIGVLMAQRAWTSHIWSGWLSGAIAPCLWGIGTPAAVAAWAIWTHFRNRRRIWTPEERTRRLGSVLPANWKQDVPAPVPPVFPPQWGQVRMARPLKNTTAVPVKPKRKPKCSHLPKNI